MKSPLLLAIEIPFIFGLVSFLLPTKSKRLPSFIALLISTLEFLLCLAVFRAKPISLNLFGENLFWVDNLSGFIILFIGLFSFLIILYSLKFINEHLNKYYAYILWTIAAAIGAVAADNLILLSAFWGMLGITLYLLIAMGGADAAGAAKKTFIIIGGSDAVLLLGIAILWSLRPVLLMSKINLTLNSGMEITAFICLALAAFAKAGAMPLHSWIPDSASFAPTTVMAFLPASLDKLLGIYLLARISLNIFTLQPNTAISLFLLIVGSVTILASVMMALVQHNFKKLLSYHAVSQVGYMILGIGTANPLGIAGGLFHMLNNAIYKSCLFLCGGNVEYRLHTDDLSKLGGLITAMPITFFSFLIASFSISGIPPFNGFVSKWLIYQGIIELGKNSSGVWIVWQTVAMFGSALTLASFMKLIHAIFLGQPAEERRQAVKEVSGIMLISPVILAIVCIVFGIFAVAIPLKLFIFPVINSSIDFIGIWNSTLATYLIVIGLIIGLGVFFLGNFKIREVRPFIGGETLSQFPQMRPSGVEFYNTVKDIRFLRFLYKKAEEKWFDIYEQGRNLTFIINSFFSYLHNGVLPSYCVWVLLGMIVLLAIFI